MDSAPKAPRFNPETLRRRYDEERDKRLKLRPQGEAQFLKMQGALAHYRNDPYTKREERPARTETVDVAIIGGGFAGLLTAARLREHGIDDIRIFDRGGDFGGTWYWNRYPGAACDVESYVYLPLLEETGAMPSAKYIQAPEILDHCRAIADKYDLYARGLLQTDVTEARFDENTARWIIKTDRGDQISARFCILASGHYREPKLPGIPGIETFKQHSFHTSRWDYDYTGGDFYSGLPNLKDKVVGIIGTGATAVQCVPHLAQWSKHLYVFQRTPSGVGVRGNQPTDPAWFKSLPPGWQRPRMDNFAKAHLGEVAEDLVNDGWTQLGRLLRARAKPGMTLEEYWQVWQMADYEIMEDVRARVDEIVSDRETAEALKPWYDWLCKRPCYHDGYLEVFNQPNVTLVDTQGQGVERLSRDAVFANGKEFKIDCLIYATGFELSPYEQGTPLPIYGRNGLPLAEKWKDGTTTMHGMHIHGFPNFLMNSSRQGFWSNNFQHGKDEMARHMVYIIQRALKQNVSIVEVTPDAESAWVKFHEERTSVFLQRWLSCTPSYFNQEGKPSATMTRDSPFGGGIFELAAILQQWRERGDMRGLKLSEDITALSQIA
jgi:cyclohexanone monooxygenase